MALPEQKRKLERLEAKHQRSFLRAAQRKRILDDMKPSAGV